MSVRVMALVFDADGLTPTQKLVLLALADHANEDGRSIYPSVKRICNKTALCERVVRRTLSELRAKDGLNVIRITGRSTMNHPNEYAINIKNLKALVPPPAPDAPPAYNAPGALDAEPPAPRAEPPAPRAPKPSLTIQESPPAPVAQKPDPVKELAAIFTELSGIDIRSVNAKSAGSQWWDPLKRMVTMANGNAPTLLRKTVGIMRAKPLNISSPNSCIKIFTSLHGESLTGPAAPATKIRYSE